MKCPICGVHLVLPADPETFGFESITVDCDPDREHHSITLKWTELVTG